MKIDRKTGVRCPVIAPKAPVTVKRCGNIIEVRYMAISPHPSIRKLDKDHYLDLLTGEVKDTNHKANRAADPASVAQSLRNLRDIINTNLTDSDAVLWVTLTYRDNMTDAQRLYEDYRRFWQRFKYYLLKHRYTSAEYIIAAEPQGRGAWHLHALFLFSDKAPFIPNSDIAQLWGHGFTKTKSLNGIDNPGLYLTAYLGDMELTEAIAAGKMGEGRLTESKNGEKAVIKGARLKMYPAGMNLYRCSRGVKKPEIYQMTEEDAQEIVKNSLLVYERTLAVTDATGKVANTIHYRQYNTVRKDLRPESIAECNAGTDFATPENQMPSQRHTAENAK